jgi:formamidopyrimidine-DNA glycosylase
VPELPEVESTRRFLEPALTGRRIVAAEVRRPRMVRRQDHPDDFAARVTGRTIRRLRRHGKFLMADLSGDLVWVTHLGMSGRVSLARKGDPESPHTNVVIRVGGGVEMRLVDPRTFGFVVAYTPEELAASPLGRLGPDAYADLPRVTELGRRLAGRTAPIKALLLDQNVIAGLGNIYADEALHRAGIAPERPAGSLTKEELGRLRRAIRVTLDAGLRWGGTSLDDLAYLLPDGRAGEFASRLRVYGKEGRPCPVCGTPIRRVVLRQRSTHWCPQCQS